MIDAYAKLSFVEDNELVYSMREGVLETVVFAKNRVPTQFVHLLTAAPLMYGSMGEQFKALEEFANALEAGVPTVSGNAKLGLLSIVNFMRRLQDEQLQMMRLAEIGPSAMTKEVKAENKSQKLFD